jgi:equilibrative nucleoside transporter 1/2/3
MFLPGLFGVQRNLFLILKASQFRALLHAADDDKPPERLSNKELFLQNTDYALDLFLIYVLTLSIFPGFLYEDTGKHQLGSW